MANRARRALLALLLLLPLCTTAAGAAWASPPGRFAATLQTTRGTMSIGGSASLSYNTSIGDTGPAASGSINNPQLGQVVADQPDSSFTEVAIAPSFGIFVADSLELALAFSIDVVTANEVLPAWHTYFVTLAARYYFGRSWWLRPYLGLSIGPQLAGSSSLYSRLLFGAEVGLAVPLRRWVALTFSLSPEFSAPLSDPRKSIFFALRTSLLGLRMYF